MTAARWRLLRMWGIQTAGFELEMATAQQKPNASTSGAVLAAIAFRNLADNSRALALQHRLEAAYDRQYNRALAMLLKLREVPDSALDETAPGDPIQLTTETWGDTFEDENSDEHENSDKANSEPAPEEDPARDE
jgi:Mg-chelatase subunit ChlI